MFWMMRHLYTPLNQNDLSLQIPTLDHRHCIHQALSKSVMTTTIVAITTQHMLVQILSVRMEAKATTTTKTSCEHSRKHQHRLKTEQMSLQINVLCLQGRHLESGCDSSASR